MENRKGMVTSLLRSWLRLRLGLMRRKGFERFLGRWEWALRSQGGTVPSLAGVGLWHNALFRNVQRQTYAHMPSVRRGAVLWEHLVQSDALQPATVQVMAPIFRSKYPSVVQVVLAVQSGDARWRG